MHRRIDRSRGRDGRDGIAGAARGGPERDLADEGLAEELERSGERREKTWSRVDTMLREYAFFIYDVWEFHSTCNCFDNVPLTLALKVL